VRKFWTQAQANLSRTSAPDGPHRASSIQGKGKQEEHPLRVGSRHHDGNYRVGKDSSALARPVTAAARETSFTMTELSLSCRRVGRDFLQRHPVTAATREHSHSPELRVLSFRAGQRLLPVMSDYSATPGVLPPQPAPRVERRGDVETWRREGKVEIWLTNFLHAIHGSSRKLKGCYFCLRYDPVPLTGDRQTANHLRISTTSNEVFTFLEFVSSKSWSAFGVQISQ
jgi:hypothetical protein